MCKCGGFSSRLTARSTSRRKWLGWWSLWPMPFWNDQLHILKHLIITLLCKPVFTASTTKYPPSPWTGSRSNGTSASPKSATRLRRKWPNTSSRTSSSTRLKPSGQNGTGWTSCCCYGPPPSTPSSTTRLSPDLT